MAFLLQSCIIIVMSKVIIDNEPIRVTLEVVQVKSMADGSPRFMVGASEKDNYLLSVLNEIKIRGGVLECVMLPVYPAKEEIQNVRRANY